MARGKKKESALTPEEKLAQALVPDWEQPYKAPTNWCWVRQNNVCSLSDGEKRKNEDFPYWEAKALRGTKEIQYVSEGKFVAKGTKVILVDGENSGEVFDVPTDGYMGSTFKALQISATIHWDYLRFFISTKQELYRNNKKGSAIPHLNKELFFNLPLPLAPKGEQARIVDRIEYLFAKLDEAKEKAQSVLDSFETRKAAILHKAFTGELTAKWRAEHGLGVDTWNKKPLVEVTFNHDSRRIPLSQAERSNLERRYDYYGASGVIDKVDRFLFEGRNLLIGEDGANLVTRSKPIAFIADGQYWVNNHAHVLSTKTEMVLDFLCYYINSIDLTPYVTGSAQPKMTQAKMNGIPVPVPSVPEQTEIVRILDSLFTKEQQAKEAAEAVLEKIDLLKKSILARAFRGELGTNDPAEQSAMELLKTVI